MLVAMPGRQDTARIAGYATFLLIGWSGLLVPSLIRSLERDLQQSDAGIGVVYFLYAVGYALGSFAGGMVTERAGRRIVLGGSAAIHGAGLLALAAAPSWTVFLLAAAPAGLGAGSLDGGTNGMFLDLFVTGRGRALNTLHLYFGVGALAAPLIIGLLSEAGVAWRVIIGVTGVVAMPLALVLAGMDVPDGRRIRQGTASATRAGPSHSSRWQQSLPLALLGIAIGTYVGAEVGVSSWLVRFLADAPLVVATASLSMFWAGLAVGRLVSARIADRFDHARFAATAALIAAVALVGAVAIPSLPVSIALFAAVGFAFGPIFPMIIALGGERYPARAAAVSGTLVGLAVVGGIVYPPAMGFISVTSGLGIAMLGTGVLSVACAIALLVTPREPMGAGRTAAATGAGAAEG